MIDDAPLIVSLGVDAVAFDRFDGLRRAHFPKGLNKIPAHLTLFHHLPGERLSDVQKVLADVATTRTPFVMAVTGLRKLGRGVALTLASPELQTVRAGIAARFADVLTPQDRQAFRPHVTIQNKVDPKAALTLHDEMAVDFVPWKVRAEALLLWRYRGGPWEAAGRFEFRPEA